MFWLTKLFEFRNQDNPEEEKSFLEHLEDLRGMLGKMIAVLIAATLLCFFFRNDLMELLRRPVKEVWRSVEVQGLRKLPREVDLEIWEVAKGLSEQAAGLREDQLQALLAAVAAEEVQGHEISADVLAFHVEVARWYRRATLVPDGPAREQFISEVPGVSDAVRRQVQALSRGGASVQPNSGEQLLVMQSLAPAEGFMLSMKLAFFAGVVLAFPFLLYFLLQFLIPGLHEREQKILFPALGVSLGLFLAGVLFCYLVVLPRALGFFYEFSQGMGIQNEWRIGDYLSFATQVTLIFGLSFELPVIVMVLVKLGLLNYYLMKDSRSYAAVAITVIAAIITPTGDALTLSFLAVPMYLLYEISIWLAWWDMRKNAGDLSEEEADRKRIEAILAGEQTVTGRAARDTEDDGPRDQES